MRLEQVAEVAAQSDPRPPRQPQARGIKTRKRLLLVGRHLFGKNGYEGTSIGDVAREAGVGVGTVYHHFSDKRALLLELLEHYEGTSRAEDWGLGGALAAAFKEADCRSAILVMLRLSIEQRRLRPNLYVVAMELGRRDSEVAALCAQIQTGHRRCIQEAIEAGQKFGTVSLEVEPEAAAFVLLQLFRAAISPISGLPPGVDIEPLVEEFADVLCRYLLVS